MRAGIGGVSSQSVEVLSKSPNPAVARRRRMVGAAGFEPATCSTQNCRATRLRYTPPGAALDTSFAGFRQAERPRSMPAVENLAPHAVAGSDPELSRSAADHLKHSAYR